MPSRIIQPQPDTETGTLRSSLRQFRELHFGWRCCTSALTHSSALHRFGDKLTAVLDGSRIEQSGNSWVSYQDYLDRMQAVWTQCARVLRPNGKLCINAPLMPVPKTMIWQHTRHLKNIAFDMEQRILGETDMQRYALFIWQKQTSKMMFGSYPHPGNIIENNTIEFINVYVKPGKPPRFARDVKGANTLTRVEWLDLTQQVWFMYPEDVKRAGEHPAPFPEKLPARLMRLYSYGATGEI